MTRSVLLLAVACVAATGCAQKVRVVTDPPGARVSWNGGDPVEVPPEGAELEVPAGVSPVPYEVEAEGKQVAGVVERTQIDWFLLGLGLGAALLCAPGLALAGVCLANPALATAVLGCAVGNVGGCAAVLAAPSWFTLPLAALGFAVGLVPFTPALLSDRLPKEVTLTTSPPSPPAAPGEEAQAW